MSSTLRQTLQSYGQTEVLRFWDELDDAGRSKLSEQLSAVDLEQLATLIDARDEQIDFAAMAERAESPPHVRADGSGTGWSIDEARQAGREALTAGRVAAVIVAGGQGTRLGFDKPKGMYPIGPVSGRTLFEIFADNLRAIAHRHQTTIPWYVMVSDATDEQTRDYFESKDYFGLGRDNVRIFKQGTMPAVGHDGKLLLSDKDALALSPDGHGGTPAALERNGVLDDCDRRGVDILSYIQVDNPLANVCDPVLIGHHRLARSEMTTQVVRKRYPKERVGNVVAVDGNVTIIEYSDLPDTAAEATNSQGELKLWAGNIAVHVIDVNFLRRMNADKNALPFHRANKKVPHLDHDGKRIEPDTPNATKFEKFIFDLLPQAANAFVVESSPAESFAPVKNADGAETDTPLLAKAALADLHRRWLIDAGVDVADDATVEIHPSVAMSSNDLVNVADKLGPITGDRYIEPPIGNR